MSQTSKLIGVMAGFTQKISADEYKRYNDELDIFFRDYRTYLELLEVWESQQDRSFLCCFSLENKGRFPAQNMDIHLHFPDGLDIFDL